MDVLRTKAIATDEQAEIARWLAIRKEEALRIDPETAELWHLFTWTLDPYEVSNDPDLHAHVGRDYWVQAPDSDIMVWWGDLPERTRDRIYKLDRLRRGLPVDDPCSQY
jgi:hypothetical protein